MTASVHAVVAAAQQLTPIEQLEVIQALSLALQQRYTQKSTTSFIDDPLSLIPATVRRVAPISDLRQLAADFWPDDETADDINAYIARQRKEDRQADSSDFDDSI